VTHSIKTAFCPLYFSAHGGRFTEKGVPIFDENIPGLCDRAFDCGTCSLMTKMVSEVVGWQLGWECDKCLKETFQEDKDGEVKRWLPGFFQSSEPDSKEYSGGCTRCGWHTSFLQIILRRHRG
jgi:hypothetical protein